MHGDTALVRALRACVQYDFSCGVSRALLLFEHTERERRCNARFVVETGITIVDKVARIDIAQPIHIAVARTTSKRWLRKRCRDARNPRIIGLNWHEIGLRKVAVIVGVFFLALQERLERNIIPTARRLHAATHRASRLAPFLDLSRRLVFNRATQRTETVEVFHLNNRCLHD